jgi:hypothetical protein
VELSPEQTLHTSLAVVRTELVHFAEEMAEVRKAMKELVAITERQSRMMEQATEARHKIEDHDDRLRRLEISQPGLAEARTWVIAIIAASITLVAGFFATRASDDYKINHRDRPTQQQQQQQPQQR